MKQQDLEAEREKLIEEAGKAGNVDRMIAIQEMEDDELKQWLWHKKKFSMVGWRGWAANALPFVVGIHSLTYIQWYWSIAIIIGGGFIMRWLINLYDNLSGNPRHLGYTEKLEGEKREQSLIRIFDLSLIGIGVALMVSSAFATYGKLLLLLIGVGLAGLGGIMLFFRTRYIRKL